jgi:chromosomal replication initiation ATPase DnaA
MMTAYHYTGPAIYDPFEKRVGPRPMSADDILVAVAKVMNVTPEYILTQGRNRTRVVARMVAVNIIYERFDVGVEELGEMFGIDHATVCHYRRRLPELIRFSVAERDIYNAVIKAVEAF